MGYAINFPISQHSTSLLYISSSSFFITQQLSSYNILIYRACNIINTKILSFEYIYLKRPVEFSINTKNHITQTLSFNCTRCNKTSSVIHSLSYIFPSFPRIYHLNYIYAYSQSLLFTLCTKGIQYKLYSLKCK